MAPYLLAFGFVCFCLICSFLAANTSPSFKTKGKRGSGGGSEYKAVKLEQTFTHPPSDEEILKAQRQAGTRLFGRWFG